MIPGSGREICTVCKGRGLLPCPTCHGNASVDSVMRCDMLSESCARCGNAREVRCEACNGVGTIVCTSCDGKACMMRFIEVKSAFKTVSNTEVIARGGMNGEYLKLLTGKPVYQ